jgi:hypothetical protein
LTATGDIELDVGACLDAGYRIRPPQVLVELARIAFERATRDGFVDDTTYLSFADVVRPRGLRPAPGLA